MKSELERKTVQLADANAEIMKLQSEVQHCKAEFLDAQRTERATRVDFEQATKKVCAVYWVDSTHYIKISVFVATILCQTVYGSYCYLGQSLKD